MPSTAKGFPSPAITDNNVNEDAIKAIADRLTALLDPKTQAQITALAGTDLWTGKTVRATDATGTTTRQQSGLYVYDGAAWQPGVGDDQPSGISGAPVLTALGGNPAMGTSPTLRWDWWILGGMYCIGEMEIIWGTGAPTPGTGVYSVSLPRPWRPWTTALLTTLRGPIGSGEITDSSLTSVATVVMNGVPTSLSTANLVADSGSANVTGASPLTLGAAGDSIRLDFGYFCT